MGRPVRAELAAAADHDAAAAAMAQAAKAPEVTKTFETAGSPVAYVDAPEFSKFVADDSARLIAAAEEIGKVEWPPASLDNGITFSCVLAVSANLRWPHSFASLQLTALETFARLQHRTNRKEPDMRTQHIVLPLALAIGGLGTAAGAEEYRGTWEQQMACTPDVWRLCGDQIPDVNRIVACLQQNTPNLSSGCRAVFQSNNSVPQAQAVPPRGRALPPPARNAPPPTSPSRPSYDDDDE